MFTRLVKIYLDAELSDLGQQGNAIQVNAANTCELPTGDGQTEVTRRCEGTSPDVKIISERPTTTTAKPIIAKSIDEATNICDSKKIDIILMIDGSGSMSSSGLDLACDFTQTIIDMLDISPMATHVSILQFSDRITTYCTFSSSTSEVNNCITNMRNSYQRGFTHTNEALYRSYDLFVQNSRGDSKKVFMILTDGQSTYGLEYSGVRYGDEIQKLGTSFGIGVGSGAPESELNEIATDPDNEYVYMIGFNDLNSETIKAGITSKMCQT